MLQIVVGISYSREASGELMTAERELCSSRGMPFFSCFHLDHSSHECRDCAFMIGWLAKVAISEGGR
jgi:hypothetical protein